MPQLKTHLLELLVAEKVNLSVTPDTEYFSISVQHLDIKETSGAMNIC